MTTQPTPAAPAETSAASVALAPGAAPTRGGSRAGRLRDVTITVLGVVGIVAVLWMVIAWLFQLSLIVFVTGSMAPAYPTGSVAVVQTVPAADLAVGDVVTVTRHNSGEPVTHRIVQIDTTPTDASARVLTLRGDANDFADSDEYRISEAPRVLFAAPVVGWVVLWTKTPVAMVAISLTIGLAIAWALWPTRERPAPASASTDL